MLKERVYKSADAATAFLDGLSEVFDENILVIGTRQAGESPQEFIAAFVDTGRDDYSEAMEELFDEEELETGTISGEAIVKRYMERYPTTTTYDVSE